MPIRVYYEDTDAGGVVYHANYLRFMERARTEWLRRLGFEHGTLGRDERIAFIVRSVEVKYQRPALLDDLLCVRAEVTRASRGLIQFRQQVERDGAVLVKADVSVACVDTGTMRLAPIPPALQRTLGGSD